MVRAGKSGSGSRAVTQQGESRKRASESPTTRAPGDQSHGRGAQSRVIRIIGGAMRGRRWRFPDIPEVRPTPDRVRETLFNWLGPRIVGARCLDLFAGSGALGLESLSRGASAVVFVEQHVAIAARARYAREATGAFRVLRFRAPMRSRTCAAPLSRSIIAFIDPPFAAGLIAPAAAALEQKGWLSPGALIYMESPAREARPDLPQCWKELKAKQAGEVGYYLYARDPAQQRQHERHAMYPGTFDPITNGHQDLVRRAAGLFERVDVAIAAKPQQGAAVHARPEGRSGAAGAGRSAERRDHGLFGTHRGVRAQAWSFGMVRGLRAVSDFEFEFQLANMSRHLAREIEDGVPHSAGAVHIHFLFAHPRDRGARRRDEGVRPPARRCGAEEAENAAERSGSPIDDATPGWRG